VNVVLHNVGAQKISIIKGNFAIDDMKSLVKSWCHNWPQKFYLVDVATAQW